MRAATIRGCVLCSGAKGCVRHKHVEDGILALFGPRNEEDDYRLIFFWPNGEKAHYLCLPLDDEKEADYHYHLAVCAGTAESIKTLLADLLRPPHAYGGVPPRLDSCGHCGGQNLRATPDPFGGYWECLQCGWTSDAVTVPQDILWELENERLQGPKREGCNL